MPVNSTHPDYDAHLPAWLRARDVLAGEDAVKAEDAAPTLNPLSAVASGRSSPGAGGLAKADQPSTALGRALEDFVDDADMLGTSLTAYARNVLNDVLAVGRAGSLIDWEDTHEHRSFVSLYRAEQ